MDIIKSSLIAMFATLFCIWLLRPLALHIGFVDRPGGRKHHEDDTPLIGGVAMFFGFCFALLSLNQSLSTYRGLIAGSSLLILMGVVDDFKELSSKLRLLGQLLAAIFLVAWGGKFVSNLGDLFFLGPIQLNLWAFPLTVLCVIGFINSMNMLDGQDGLAGGVALTQISLLLWFSWRLQLFYDVRMLFIVAVLLVAFLFYNVRLPWRKKALIFMGDSGVTFIAFLIAWFSIELSQYHHMTHVKPISILWILAFPVFDLFAVTIHRIYQGKSILHASRDHLHHMLMLAGVSVPISTMLLCLISLLLGVFGIVLNYFHMREGYQFLLFLLCFFVYMITIKCVRNPLSKSIQNERC